MILVDTSWHLPVVGFFAFLEKARLRWDDGVGKAECVSEGCAALLPKPLSKPINLRPYPKNCLERVTAKQAGEVL